MVSGLPRMCMRISPAPAAATVPASAASYASPAPSFPPAPRARRVGPRREQPHELRDQAFEIGGGAVVAAERREAARRGGDEGPAVAGENVGAAARAPAYQGLALGFGDVFEEDDEWLDPRRRKGRLVGFPPARRERRAHRFRGVRSERGGPHAPAGSGGGLPRTGPRADWGLPRAPASAADAGLAAGVGACGGSGLPATTRSTSPWSSVSRSSSACASRSSTSRRAVMISRARS